MREVSILTAQCEKCDNTWYPYGRFQQQVVPHEAKVSCPKCKHQQTTKWLDSESYKLYAQKELGLLNNDNTNQKIKDLEHKLELLTKEVELEKKKRELFEVELEKLNTWAEGREEDFRHIETLAQEMDEEYEFREDNK